MFDLILELSQIQKIKKQKKQEEGQELFLWVFSKMGPS